MLQGNISYSIIGLHLFYQTFPHNKNTDTFIHQASAYPQVSLFVLPELFNPELTVIIRVSEITAAFMCMPETAMNENSGIVFCQPHIRMTFFPGRADPITDSLSEQTASQIKLRFCIPALYSSHIIMPFILCQNIHRTASTRQTRFLLPFSQS